MLAGLWESAKAIIGTIRSVLDGSIFQYIKDIYDEIMGLSMAKALEMAQSVINMGNAVTNFASKTTRAISASQRIALSNPLKFLLKASFPWSGVVVAATLRSTPNKNSKDPKANLVTYLSKGDKVTVTGNSGNWLAVTAKVGGQPFRDMYLKSKLTIQRNA